MGSTFDDMMRDFGAPVLFEQLGERDANGEFVQIEIANPNAEARQFAAIVGALQVADDDQAGEGITEHDEIRETCTVQVAAGVVVEIGAKVAVPRYPGERFTVDSTNAGAMLTLQLSRYRIADIKRRGYTRGGR